MYAEYTELARQLQNLTLGDYLEFGCGDGGFLQYVLDQNRSFKSITAVDINPDSVEKARKNLADYNIHFIVDGNIPLDLDANSFSSITLSNTLHHLQDKESVFAELRRLIKPHGQIIITEMVSNDLTRAEQTYCRFHALRAETDRLKGTYHDTTYSAGEVEKLVTRAGLSITKKQIILNEKLVVTDAEEVRKMETNIDDLVQGEKESPEIEALTNKAERIKAHLRAFGIKRPRQLYIETSL